MREIVFVVLKNIKYSTIFGYYNSYIKKMNKYKKNIKYKFLHLKKFISYIKIFLTKITIIKIPKY